MQTTKRMDNLDLLKALAILAVISLHIPLWDLPGTFATSSSAFILSYGMRVIFEPVPVFLLINGMLLLKKQNFDLQKHIKKIFHIILVMLVWALLLSVAGCIADQREITLAIIWHLMFQTQVGSEYTGVLWFLQNLLIVYFIFPMLWYIYQNRYEIFRFFFLVLILMAHGLVVLYLISDAFSMYYDMTWLREVTVFFERSVPVGDIWYVFYFCLGGVIWKHQEWIKEHRILLIILGVVGMLLAIAYGVGLSYQRGEIYNPNYNYSSPFYTLTLLGFYGMTLSYQKTKFPLKIWIASVGNQTFGIYLSHFLFIFALSKWLPNDTLPQRMVLLFAVLVCSYLFSCIISKIPYLKEIMKI